ncbi:type II secretion system protein GspD [Uliginosibacterium gangwonense]|uniref:type II secretion system protein GspD n=1 Tax=Uliginosibacterium gangwonense TaxID=392736 RepID=UPI000361FABD|nr:secretin N-terminal domain-containing protein [Uliginosibacterium gangwonense]
MTKRPHTHSIGLCLLAAFMLCACSITRPRNDKEAPAAQTTPAQTAESSAMEYPNLGNEPNTTVTGRDRYAKYLKERAEAALAQRQYDEAGRLFKQLGRIPGYEAQGQEGVRRLPANTTSTTSTICQPPDPKKQVAVCQPYSNSSAQAGNPGDMALGKTILEDLTPAPVVNDTTTAPSVADSAPVAAAPAKTKSATPAHGKQKGAPAAAQTASAEAPPEAPASSIKEDPLQKRVTLEFRDASVRSLFDAITRASGLNVIFDRDVSPDIKTTVYLRNTTIKAAIDKIVLTSALAWRKLDENTLLVYADDTNKQHDYQALVIRGFQLFNADAKFVASSLKTVLKFKDVVVDEKLNMVVVRDTPEALALAEKLIALHDVPEPEVMLEVAVLQVDKGKLKSLGVDWPGAMSLTPLARSRPTDTATSSDGSTTTGRLTLRDLWNLTPGSLGMGLSNATVNFSASNSNTQILANPSIRVRNREKAKILIGERVPNISSSVTSTGVTSESITYVDVGLKLDVEPQIYPGNEIGLKLALEVSSINSTVKTTSGIVAYRIGTRTAATVLRLNDGENQILGGLIQDTDKKSTSKVPLLGDIPILGSLFSSDSTEKDKTEIVLSITPRLVRGNHRLSPEVSGFDAGTISSVRGRRNDADASNGNASMPESSPVQAPVNQTNTSQPLQNNNADVPR